MGTLDSTECPRCGVSADRHGTFCEREDLFNKMFKGNDAVDLTQTAKEPVVEASREDPVAKELFVHPYPVAWAREPDQFRSSEWSVGYKRFGGRRWRYRIFQREFYALRFFRRLMRNPRGMGLARIEDLCLQEREVSEWITTKDLPWRR